MADARVSTNRHVQWRVGPDTGITNWAAPTLANIVALTDITEAVRLAGTEVNIEASDQGDDRGFLDEVDAQSRSFPNFGGAMALFKNKQADVTSVAYVARQILKTPWTKLIVATRFVPLATGAPAAGDEWYIFHVAVDANKHERGEISQAYTVNLVPQNDLLAGYILPPASAVAVTVSGSATGTLSLATPLAVDRRKATYQGRNITIGATWVSSDPTKVLVSKHGIAYLAPGATVGTAIVTATYPGALPSTGVTYTVGA